MVGNQSRALPFPSSPVLTGDKKPRKNIRYEDCYKDYLAGRRVRWAAFRESGKRRSLDLHAVLKYRLCIFHDLGIDD